MCDPEGGITGGSEGTGTVERQIAWPLLSCQLLGKPRNLHASVFPFAKWCQYAGSTLRVSRVYGCVCVGGGGGWGESRKFLKDPQRLPSPSLRHCLELSQRYCRMSQASERTGLHTIAVGPVRTSEFPEPSIGSALPETDFGKL